jgi:hypothetical protein
MYACPWYKHLQTMRDVKFVIMRAQNPVRLTAGKFYTVSLETFLQVLGRHQQLVARSAATDNMVLISGNNTGHIIRERKQNLWHVWT